MARWFLFALSVSPLFVVVTEAAGADRLILRNLKLITDRTVTQFDEDGVQLDNDQLLAWDEIERGTLATKQAAFDRLVKELGEPLYRLRQRMKVGDYPGLLEPAAALWPRYRERRSEAAYLVFQSLMWGRLANGQRELAVEPYLLCYDFVRDKKPSDVTLPGTRRLRFDPATGMSPELPPVWFDAAAAKQALPLVVKAAAAVQEPRPEGARIYFATLALAAGETESALKALRAMKSSAAEIMELRTIALAQQEVQAGQSGDSVVALKLSIREVSVSHQPAALYWLGRAEVAATDLDERRSGVLRLLHIPALFGDTYPDLAAASLYEAMQALEKLDDTKGSIALRKELLGKYGQTWHGTKLKGMP